MRIAMLGLRGVPATFGGIERHVEEVGARLAAMGHDVTVFCRTNYSVERIPRHRGMHLAYLPTIGTKHLDAIVHTGAAALRSLRGFDVAHYHALGPGLVSPAHKYLSHAAVVQTVHGLDHERAKWGPFARRVLSFAERMSARVPDETIVISRSLADHFLSRYGRRTTFIPNGVAATAPLPPGAVLHRYSLEPGRYILFVGRLVPEKAPDVLVRAFARVLGDLRLVIVGGTSFSDDYVRSLHRLAADDARVVFTGYLYGDDLAEIYSNAAVFVSPSTLEGNPITMLEAIGYGIPVLVSDIAPHLEPLAGERVGARVFRSGDVAGLEAALVASIEDRDRGADLTLLRKRILQAYDWDTAARRTADVYARAVER